ncbi:MAG: glycerophosphodiester phosphodiesterase [Candidatus Helarchaeota archaeon]
MTEFRIIAHRGASGYELENSYAAFEKAVKLGADMIETDVWKTLDDHLVLMHDNNIDRTTFGTGKISKMTLQQIKEVKMKNNEQIPLLEDVLKKYGKKIGFNIEIKAKNIEKKVNELIEKFKLVDNIMISCFSLRTLENLNLINPDLNTALLTFLPWSLVSIKSPLKKIKEVGINAINPFFKFISKRFVKKAHENGVKIYPWTVNNKDIILKLKNKYFVDGIITNIPDILLSNKD